jgi:hypothetical protein
MQADLKNPSVLIVLYICLVGIQCFVVWLVGRVYHLPALRTWCDSSGYTLEHYRSSFFHYYHYARSALPGGPAWRYFRVKVADKAGQTREGLVYVGKQDVWVFWDSWLVEHVTWEELMKPKSKRSDDLLA